MYTIYFKVSYALTYLSVSACLCVCVCVCARVLVRLCMSENNTSYIFI